MEAKINNTQKQWFCITFQIGMPSGSESSAGASPGAVTLIVISAGGGAPAGSGGKRIFTAAYGHDSGAHNYLQVILILVLYIKTRMIGVLHN